uniref:Uncharacterized protein n=1 Tax=viral metagenome TaxID=1070528 RepID=A0A6C0H7Z4_9ZZZZ
MSIIKTNNKLNVIFNKDTIIQIYNVLNLNK